MYTDTYHDMTTKHRGALESCGANADPTYLVYLISHVLAATSSRFFLHKKRALEEALLQHCPSPQKEYSGNPYLPCFPLIKTQHFIVDARSIIHA